MQIHTTARHCELDPEVRLSAQTRIEKLSRYARDLQEAHLIVTGEGYRYTAEITLRLKGRELISREQADEAGLAVDRAADRLERQLRRLKEYRVDRRRGRVVNGRAPEDSVASAAGSQSPGDGDDGMEFLEAEEE